MPAWLDMRETRHVREQAVASSWLPYWNAEGLCDHEVLTFQARRLGVKD